MEINGKVSVVTGGASGLGEATVKSLVAAGAKVAILDNNAEQGNKAANQLGDNALFCETDVTLEDSVQSAIEITYNTFGAIHIAVSCAGVLFPAKVISKKGLFPMDRFNTVIQVNLMGTMNLIRLAGIKMQENRPTEDGEVGVIINTASVAAFEGQIGHAAYSASKGGVASMTLPIAREFAEYGIRVVSIAPGLFQTPMMMGVPESARNSLAEKVAFPKRFGYPHEYAHLVKCIIENAMLNGCTIRLDAAFRMQAK